jgi:hypothetical protein
VLFAATGLWSVGVGQFVYLAVTGVMALVFTALFVVLGMCAAREKLPLDLTKLPSPEYWLSPEHRPVLNALVAELMYEIGAGLVLFVALLNVGLSAGWSWDWGPARPLPGSRHSRCSNPLFRPAASRAASWVERHRHRFRADQFRRAPCSVIGAM